MPAFESETQLTRLKKSLSRLTPDVCPTSNLTAQIITSIQVTPVVVFVTAARPPIPVLSGACRDAKSTIGWLQDTHPPPHHGLSSQGRSPPCRRRSCTTPALNAPLCSVTGLFPARVYGRVSLQGPSLGVNLAVGIPLFPRKTIVYVTDLKMVKSNLRAQGHFVLSFRDPRSARRLVVGDFPAFEIERTGGRNPRHPPPFCQPKGFVARPKEGSNQDSG